MSRRIFVLLLVVLTIALFPLLEMNNIGYSECSTDLEIDAITTVTNIIDGDTFDSLLGRVRLADINAPELDEPGGYEAKNALTSLILNRVVYLDIDDIYGTDPYGRIVAVVYVRYNSTHLLNVNKWLLDNGYAVIADYPNEFNPYLWRLYVRYPIEEPPTNNTIIPPSIFVNAINVDIFRVKELELTKSIDLIYLQPYTNGNNTRILIMYKYNMTHNVLKILDINGNVLISKFLQIPQYLYPSYDLSKLVVLIRHGYPVNTTIVIIDLNSLSIQKIEIPMSIYHVSIYDNIVAFRVPNKDQILLFNISSNNITTYTLNFNLSDIFEKLLLVIGRIALLSTSYKLYIYDLINNTTLKTFYCEYCTLTSLNKRYAIVECTSRSNRYTYRDYIILDLKSLEYKKINVYEALEYNVLAVIDTNNGSVVIGYEEYSPLGIGGAGIYVLNISNEHSWYSSIGLRNYLIDTFIGKLSSIGRYIGMILYHKESNTYTQQSTYTDKLALLIVDPDLEKYTIIYIDPCNDTIIHEYSYITKDYMFIPIKRQERIYLEVFKLSILESRNEVYILNLSYMNTIATSTITIEKTKTITRTVYDHDTVTVTKTLTYTYKLGRTKSITITLTKTVPITTTEIVTKTVTEEKYGATVINSSSKSSLSSSHYNTYQEQVLATFIIVITIGLIITLIITSKYSSSK